jgi:DNA-binding transcriptional LysR family regulator
MKLHHFRDVVAIAEQGSIRAAARRLRLAQPALTRSLGELERELGVPLFERRARGMAPTPTGLAFVQRAQAVLNEVRRARDDVDQLKEGAGGRLVVGLSIAAHLALLPNALHPFTARYPGVKLHVIEGFYPTLEAGLRNGTVDFYVGPSPEGVLPAEFASEELFRNTRIILCRRSHPLIASRSLSDLADTGWATTSITMKSEEEFRDLFQSYGLPTPRIVLQSQSALTLMVSIAATDLLAMVPQQWMSFAPATNALASIPIRETLPAPTIVLIQRAGVPLTPAATYFSELMRKFAVGIGRTPVAARQRARRP